MDLIDDVADQKRLEAPRKKLRVPRQSGLLALHAIKAQKQQTKLAAAIPNTQGPKTMVSQLKQAPMAGVNYVTSNAKKLNKTAYDLIKTAFGPIGNPYAITAQRAAADAAPVADLPKGFNPKTDYLVPEGANNAEAGTWVRKGLDGEDKVMASKGLWKQEQGGYDAFAKANTEPRINNAHMDRILRMNYANPAKIETTPTNVIGNPGRVSLGAGRALLGNLIGGVAEGVGRVAHPLGLHQLAAGAAGLSNKMYNARDIGIQQVFHPDSNIQDNYDDAQLSNVAKADEKFEMLSGLTSKLRPFIGDQAYEALRDKTSLRGSQLAAMQKETKGLSVYLPLTKGNPYAMAGLYATAPVSAAYKGALTGKLDIPVKVEADKSGDFLITTAYGDTRRLSEASDALKRNLVTTMVPAFDDEGKPTTISMLEAAKRNLGIARAENAVLQRPDVATKYNPNTIRHNFIQADKLMNADKNSAELAENADKRVGAAANQYGNEMADRYQAPTMAQVLLDPRAGIPNKAPLPVPQVAAPTQTPANEASTAVAIQDMNTTLDSLPPELSQNATQALGGMAKARQDFYKAQGMDVPDNVVLAQVWKEYKAQVDAQNASKPDDGLASQGLLPYLAAGGLGLGGAGLLYGLSRRDDKETKKKRRALGLGRD